MLWVSFLNESKSEEAKSEKKLFKKVKYERKYIIKRVGKVNILQENTKKKKGSG